ncbi:MAG: hypothetical protein A3G18_09530 [Rhodospirillales bacterium RIFCSPLOWO2_12_FULL_58_28]|nr:MAG: hypothetical protein A3H92_02140 [Rhodospirillales bacterium RIFCSPLOWO2_02_FULL_58_16]OHC76743.1 MAG: hypothetical protein A3G18_09530 [Rhodospirillales bacterium RIFCSPLOWO2_12_FULL_58_28]
MGARCGGENWELGIMFFRPLLAAVVVTAGVVLSARFVLYTPDGTDADGSSVAVALAKSSFSLGNSAAAATLHPRLPGERGVILPADPPPFSTSLVFSDGDTLTELLKDAGASYADAAAATVALGQYYNPRHIKAGQEITVAFKPRIGFDGSAEVPGRFNGFSMAPDYTRLIAVSRSDKGGFAVTEEERKLSRNLVRATGEIRDSLFVAASRAGLPAAVLAELIRAYSWDVDFQRDIHPGDHFEIMFERFRGENGSLVHDGRILYAALRLSGKRRSIYFHTLSDGQSDYFNEKGQSARRALMRTPIDGARLSSGFGQRRHPILGYMKQHRGVDFAAAPGTPVYAAGDGVVEEAGWNGDYGKYVRIRHNSEYSTAYAHMNSIKIGKGKRVRQGQVIGHVGSTGRSTGPHLHYEILKSGVRANPLLVKMQSGRELKGAALTRFMEAVTKVDYQLSYLAEDAAETRVAGAEVTPR